MAEQRTKLDVLTDAAVALAERAEKSENSADAREFAEAAKFVAEATAAFMVKR